MVNRTQALVLGFFVAAWIGLVAILLAAPEVYDQVLNSSPGNGLPKFAFLAAISTLIALLGIGVIRRWRWSFWLILIALLAGILRVPTSILQLTGVLHAGVPTWYVVLQGLVGMVQVVIGLTMVAGYRKAGVWGAF